MKIEIDTDDLDLLERFEDYDHETKDTTHRRWGNMSWLYPGDLVIQIGDKSAAAIVTAIELDSVIRKAQHDEKEKTT